MSLSKKTLLLLSLILTFYVLLTLAIQRMVMFPSFVELEREEAEGDLRRVVRAVRSEVDHLSEHCHDWASWDDSYEFVAVPSQAWVDVNLVESTFVSARLNLIAFYDGAGRLVWSAFLDYLDMSPLGESEFSRPALPMDHPLIRATSRDVPVSQRGASGVYLSELGPLLVSSRPILDSAEQLPSRGTLIMGRLFAGPVKDDLLQRTEVSFRFWELDDASMPEEAHAAAETLAAPDRYMTRELSSNALAVYTLLNDVSGAPALVLQGDVPRNITTRGRSTLRFGLMTVGTAGIALVVILLVLLRRSVISPLQQLTHSAVAIGNRDDLQVRASMARRDEIGRLAHEFDRMVERLANARKRLLEQSYYSGMAVMASGILHNVRNALSPLAVEVEALQDQLKKAPIDTLDRAGEELARADLSEERRRDLTEFSLVACRKLSRTVGRIRKRMAEILVKIGQIEQILNAQGEFGEIAHPVETIRVRELLDDTLAMLPHGLLERAEIQVADTIDAMPPIQAHRLQLMQVMANLLTNAVEATAEAGTVEPVVRVGGRLDFSATGGTLHLTVEDNGTGIPPEIVPRLFERGFSTKPSGHSGLGLHWCANTVRAMNGDIRVENLGTGNGARFHITIPTLSQSETSRPKRHNGQ